MSTSKLQESAKARLRLILADYKFTENYRPNWLRNPQTEAKLELDFWLPEPRIAVEVQGRQHYEFVPHFHRTIEAFHRQLERDKFKKETCQQRGIFLYEVFTLEDIDRFIEAVREHDSEMAAILLRKHTAIKIMSYYAARLYVETRKKKPEPYKLARYTRKIVSLASRYRLPLKLVEPDFDITKVSLVYPNKPTVRVKLITDEEIILKTIWAAIESVEGNTAHLRWESRYKRTVTQMSEDFDLVTGYQLNPSLVGMKWWIRNITIRRPINKPDEPIYEQIVKVFKDNDPDWQPREQEENQVQPFNKWKKYKKDQVMNVWPKDLFTTREQPDTKG